MSAALQIRLPDVESFWLLRRVQTSRIHDLTGVLHAMRRFVGAPLKRAAAVPCTVLRSGAAAACITWRYVTALVNKSLLCRLWGQH